MDPIQQSVPPQFGGEAGVSGASAAAPAAQITPSDLPLLHAKVLEHLGEAVLITDVRGRILFSNPEQDRIAGYERGELIGQHISTLGFVASETSSVEQQLAELQSGGQWAGELLSRTKQGHVIRQQARIAANEIDGRKYWITIQRDLSGQQGTGTASSLLAAIIESSEDAIISEDLNGIITSWNRSAEVLFGYSSAEVIGRSIKVLSLPDRTGEIDRILDRVKRGERLEHYETKRVRKDGSVFPVSLSLSPIRDETGVIVGASKIVRDISRRKKAEEAQIAREREFRTLLANLPDVVSRYDRNGRLIYISPAIEKALNLSPNHLIGKTLPEAGIPAPVANLFQRMLAQVFETSQPVAIQFQLSGPDGEMRHHDGLGIPELGTDGQVESVLTIMRDITEQTRAQEAQKSIERELLLLVEASGALLGSPSLPDVQRTIIELARQFVSADAYSVWRLSPDGEWRITNAAGLSEEFVRRGRVDVLPDDFGKQPVLIEDVQSDPSLKNRAELLRVEGVKSLLVIPLIIHGETESTVALYWKTFHKSSTPELRIAVALGNLAAAALGIAKLYGQQTESKERAERAERRASFLAQAGAVLSSSLDYETTLANVARLAVPQFADVCAVQVVDERGNLQRVAIEHSDPKRSQFIREYLERYPPNPYGPVAVALRTGKPLLIEELDPQSLRSAARDQEHLQMLLKFNPRSVMIAPMLLNDQLLGAISFVQSESSRQYGPADIEVAEELGRRAATAIVHSRLYDAVRTNEERLRLAIGAAGLGVWEYDVETGGLAASEHCKRMLGANSEDPLTYHDLMIRIHERDREAWNRALQDSIRGAGGFSVECRIIWPKQHASPGEPFHWISAHGRMLPPEDGQPKRIVGVMLDITERRHLLLREQEARTTAELLNSIGPLLLTQLNPEKVVQTVTNIATTLVGAQLGALFYQVKGSPEGEALLYSLTGDWGDVFAPATVEQDDALTGKLLQHGKAVRLGDLTHDH